LPAAHTQPGPAERRIPLTLIGIAPRLFVRIGALLMRLLQSVDTGVAFVASRALSAIFGTRKRRQRFDGPAMAAVPLANLLMPGVAIAANCVVSVAITTTMNIAADRATAKRLTHWRNGLHEYAALTRLVHNLIALAQLR
jgi:hypothetical protein